MRIFRIRGGVHPEYHKELSSERPIVDLPLPDLLHVPMKQHSGEISQPVVRRGDVSLVALPIHDGQRPAEQVSLPLEQ